MPNLKAIKQPLPLAKMAYKALRDSILTRGLVPGEIYNEKMLAAELGISRTPVREALLELSSQGLVTFLPRKGIIVNRYTIKDVEDIFELRNVIEVACVVKVAKASPPLNLSQIDNAFREMKSANKNKDYLALLDADRTFHLKICELAENRRLLAIQENSRDMIHMMGIHALAMEDRSEEVITEHGEVLKAIKQGKPSTARKAMEYHLNRSKEAVLERHNVIGK
jgi:DNA-binding GntR family transcriptional regulator